MQRLKQRKRDISRATGTYALKGAAQGFLKRALPEQGQQLRRITAPVRTDGQATLAEVGDLRRHRIHLDA